MGRTAVGINSDISTALTAPAPLLKRTQNVRSELVSWRLFISLAIPGQSDLSFVDDVSSDVVEQALKQLIRFACQEHSDNGPGSALNLGNTASRHRDTVGTETKSWGNLQQIQKNHK